MSKRLYIPEPLKKGDTLAVAASAGNIQEMESFWNGISVIREMGFDVRFPRDLWPGTSYLADNDDNRANELNQLFRDPDIKGIISLRGGYGCMRMLSRVDTNLVINNPKFLVGFSDITILLNYLYEQAGLVSLHGPVVTSLPGSTPETIARLFRSLTGQHQATIDIPGLEILKDGPPVRAPVIGGNLASLVTMLGTWADCSWSGKIIILEDINEPLYKVDRMLTQLELAGKFENVRGVILGDFANASHHDSIEKIRYTEKIWERLVTLCYHRDIVVWGNFPAGHNPTNHTFPIGMTGEMNKDRKQLRFHRV